MLTVVSKQFSSFFSTLLIPKLVYYSRSSESDSMNASKSDAKSYKRLDRSECEQIRVFSRRSWERHALQRDRSATTYAAEHPHKTLDEPTARRARPCSPTRRHKSHQSRPVHVIIQPAQKRQTTGACYQVNTYLHQALCSHALLECVPAVNHWLSRATDQDAQFLEGLLKSLSEKR